MQRETLQQTRLLHRMLSNTIVGGLDGLILDYSRRQKQLHFRAAKCCTLQRVKTSVGKLLDHEVAKRIGLLNSEEDNLSYGEGSPENWDWNLAKI